MANTQPQPATTRPEPSALSALTSSATTKTPETATSTQVLHNLQHQHLWTSLLTHTIATPPSTKSQSQPQSQTITLVSGIPPHRVYTHPDEQLWMLENGIREDDLRPERMFAIPTAHGQAWSLAAMAAVFDELPGVAGSLVEYGRGEKKSGDEGDEMGRKLARYYEKREAVRASKEWGSERLLLAMVDRGMGGDGTVAYYVVQEGEVKPRQN
ncbi:uncharacterized protein N7511_010088 [Penicillium nucicola]|uniref:uncharacterized protein n=1 Tax=Penicillium nucicola TaxID=1850975 RepID=UPI002544FB5F|nr:uncharacterized protein N7511_010088 [Penicillium nucicola]KAJ5748392.1 hypothetical protein N7511_010088 [Penicillium nucicola]